MINTERAHSQKRITRQIITLAGDSYEAVLGEDLMIEIAHVGRETINLEWLAKVCPELQQTIFTTLTDLLHTHSEKYAITTSTAARSAWQNSKLFGAAPICLEDISDLLQSPSPKSYQPFVRPVLQRLLALSPDLFNDDVVSFLRGEGKWEESENGSYFGLMTNCPESGALTDQELHNFHTALNRSFANGEITQQDFALTWMCIGTGLRPIQIARMTRSDVTIHDGPEGNEVMLRVPLAKGEGANKGEYWLRRAPAVLAEALIAYLDSSSGSPGDNLFFNTSQQNGMCVKKVGEKIDSWSERLGTRIPISAYRFRYTMATRALANGATDWEVARLMTHRSTTCIQYYRASMPELLNPIESALGKEMDYFARAFQGRLINDLSEATRKDEGEAEIMDFLHLTRGEAIGACGTRAQCYMNAPVACLSCSRFEPYRDAPWEELLDRLTDDADREDEKRIKDINLNAMSAIKGIIDEREQAAQNV